MRIEKLDAFYVLDKLDNHKAIKPKLLALIKNAVGDSEGGHSADVIQKLDWTKAKDFSRPWTKYFTEAINDKLLSILSNLGYNEYAIDELWFQQYVTGGYHGWHAHGSSFTAVYYLELAKDAPKTELIEPYMHNRKIIADVQEGDLLLFPSFVIHRAPRINVDTRKTIISFNINFYSADQKTLNKIEYL